MEENVVGQIYRQVRRIRLGLKIGDLRRPPADVKAREHHAAAALKQASLIVRYVDDDRRKNVRMEDQVIVTCAGLVELSPHRRIFKLQHVAGIVLRKRTAGTAWYVGRSRRC